MNLFDVLDLIGGLCLFLFGMNLMGAALEKRAGKSLTTLLGKLTGNKIAGCVIEMSQSKPDLHDYSKAMRDENHEYADTSRMYAEKYLQNIQ